mmetsp:Transcript_101138/g.324909  ORF Transcript_101138/g.324909 Transcript_101138/m.324909 type:complete len:226 (-) Transcript_101138:6155-6832(-)
MSDGAEDSRLHRLRECPAVSLRQAVLRALDGGLGGLPGAEGLLLFQQVPRWPQRRRRRPHRQHQQFFPRSYDCVPQQERTQSQYQVHAGDEHQEPSRGGPRRRCRAGRGSRHHVRGGVGLRQALQGVREVEGQHPNQDRPAWQRLEQSKVRRRRLRHHLSLRRRRPQQRHSQSFGDEHYAVQAHWRRRSEGHQAAGDHPRDLVAAHTVVDRPSELHCPVCALRRE